MWDVMEGTSHGQGYLGHFIGRAAETAKVILNYNGIPLTPIYHGTNFEG
jgi:hypothetical protein